MKNSVRNRKKTMSKFTTALEKIQAQKEQKKIFSGKLPSSSLMVQEPEEPLSHWEADIPSIRDAQPEKRVVTHHFPHSLISEQYRMMRTNLKTHIERLGGKVFLISSSVHGEGKTLTAVNLAISLAEMENCKVALIDGDLRRGKVADYLGLGKDLPGLSDLLEGNLCLQEGMVRNSLENLFILPRGKTAPNASELVASQNFRILMAELRRHFDYILIDSPPILSVVDASLIASETDGLLMVIQSRKTPKNVVAQAHHLFYQAGANMLGYILTNVEYQSADTRYYYHNYHYVEQINKKRRIEARLHLALRKVEQKFIGLEEKFNRWWAGKVFKK